jgi:flavin reductase (DIM6/NTAB) family NADH-FMN oxidoreductase RutF
MFEKEKWPAGTLLAPVPAVLISCGDMEKSNILTVAWTGIINSDPAKTYISIRKERYSYDIIKNTREFVINLTTKDLVFATDFCGVRSGKNIDKFKEMKLSKQPGNEVKVPLIGESPINIECRVTDIVELGSHDMFISDILCVDVAKDLVDDKGKLDLTKANLIAYSHGEYFTLGEKLGKFGFSVKKK